MKSSLEVESWVHPYSILAEACLVCSWESIDIGVITLALILKLREEKNKQMGIVQFNEYGVLDTWFFILNQLLNILMGEEIQNSNFLLDQTKSLRAFISKIINFISSLIIFF